MRWLIAFVLLLGVAGAYVWRRNSAQAGAARPRALSIIQPEVRIVRSTVQATGVVRLRSGAEVRVGAQLSGIVTRLNVTVGSRVQRGVAIAQIDSHGLEARIEQAEAQVNVDRIALEKEKQTFARVQALSSAGLIATQQAEDAESDLRSAEAKVKKSEDDEEVVKADLPYALIRAPISGTISSISTQEGETVAASFAAPTFVTILEDNALELVAMVDETDIGNVRPGQDVQFTVQTFADREYTGKVVRIAPAGTIISGVVNYEVGIRLDKPAGLKPDMTANVAITTARHSALMIPVDCLRREGARRFVYVSRNGNLTRRNVTSGAADEGFIEIRDGLSEQDHIAVLSSDPQQKTTS